VHKVSNQYAAMPSLHFAWSAWCTLVFLPSLRRPWARILAISYPFLTLFAIVVTGNHYIIDAVGGAVILAVGYLLGRAFTDLWARRAAAAEARAVEQEINALPDGRSRSA
jgi:membrane-associated phospholipid phosphatase